MSFTPDQVKISDHQYRAFVHPQLVSISDGFSSLLFMFNDELKQYRSLVNSINALYKEEFQLHESCKNKILCEKQLSHLKERLTQLLKLIKEQKNTKNKISFKDLEQIIFKLYVKLAQNDILLRYEFLSHNIYTNYHHLFNQIYIDFYEKIFAELPLEIRDETKRFWPQFIHPIRSSIIHQADKKRLKHQINNLNYAINLYHAELTKRNKKISSGVKSTLNIMHRRWNSILKLAL